MRVWTWMARKRVRADDAASPKRVRTVEWDAASLDPSELTSIMFNLPAGLRVLVQEDGKARGISVAAVMRIVTAEHYGYDLPVTLRQSTARRKYATPEDALAAKKAKADELRRVHRAFMEAYARGEQGAVEIMERANAGS